VEIKKYDELAIHNKHGKFYRDPKTLSENGNRLWWSKDTANHGGTEWKLYEESSTGLTRIKAIDKYGNYMNRHQGEIGEFIPWKDLRGIHVKK
jgi:filamentous hemagglutinin